MGAKNTQCITITTDASLKDKEGSYAFIAKHDDFIIRGSGPFKGSVSSPTEAEVKAICNAVTVAAICMERYGKTCTHIIINTDSKNGIREIMQKKNKYSKRCMKAIERLVRKTSAIDYRLQYVKAHTTDGTPREHVNNQCDQWAKQARVTKVRNINIKIKQ